MKQYLYILTSCLIISITISCRKNRDCTSHNTDYINSTVKSNFTYRPGSYWIFENNLLATDSIIIKDTSTFLGGGNGVQSAAGFSTGCKTIIDDEEIVEMKCNSFISSFALYQNSIKIHISFNRDTTFGFYYGIDSKTGQLKSTNHPNNFSNTEYFSTYTCNNLTFSNVYKMSTISSKDTCTIFYCKEAIIKIINGTGANSKREYNILRYKLL